MHRKSFPVGVPAAHRWPVMEAALLAWSIVASARFRTNAEGGGESGGSCQTDARELAAW